MHRSTTFRFAVVAVALAVVTAACGSHPGPVVAEPPHHDPVVPSEVAGYWTGDWGRLVLRDSGTGVRGVYDHDEGTITATVAGGKLTGWWCEVPARQPSGDAGDVELTFVTAADGARTIDGRWRYGTDGEWREDWDLAWDSGAPPAELVARFDDPSAFCAHP